MFDLPGQSWVAYVRSRARRTPRSPIDLMIAVSAITVSVFLLNVAVGHGRTKEMLPAAKSWPFPLPVESRDGVERGKWLGIMPAPEAKTVLAWWAHRGFPGLSSNLANTLLGMRVQACYCRALDECWISDLSATTEPRPVAECSPIADAYSGSMIENGWVAIAKA